MNLEFTKQIINHPVIKSLDELNLLNQAEVLDGYMADASTVPWEKSASFVHGWRNRQMDLGLMPKTYEAGVLAAEWLKNKRRVK